MKLNEYPEKLQSWWFITLSNLQACISFIYRYCFYGELSKKISTKWKEAEFQFLEYCLQLLLCGSKWFKICHSTLIFLTITHMYFPSTYEPRTQNYIKQPLCCFQESPIYMEGRQIGTTKFNIRIYSTVGMCANYF